MGQGEAGSRWVLTWRNRGDFIKGQRCGQGQGDANRGGLSPWTSQSRKPAGSPLSLNEPGKWPTPEQAAAVKGMGPQRPSVG